MKYNWHDMARHLVLLWNLGNKLRFVFVLCRGLVGLATPCRGCGCGGSGAVDVRGSASTVNGHVACRASNRVYLVKLGHTSGHGTFSDRVVGRLSRTLAGCRGSSGLHYTLVFTRNRRFATNLSLVRLRSG